MDRDVDPYRHLPSPTSQASSMIICASTPGLPPLLELRGDDEMDLTLDVFSHISTHPPNADLKPGYGNVHRLTQLGGHTFRFAATQFYFSYRPTLRENELVVGRVSF